VTTLITAAKETRLRLEIEKIPKGRSRESVESDVKTRKTYLLCKLQLPEIINTRRKVPKNQSTGSPSSFGNREHDMGIGHSKIEQGTGASFKS